MKKRCPKRLGAQPAGGVLGGSSSESGTRLPTPRSETKSETGSPSLKTAPGHGKGSGLMRMGDRDRVLLNNLHERDEHWSDGAFARENGRFGLHPLHDDYSEDSES